jgi:hypothetical protein
MLGGLLFSFWCFAAFVFLAERFQPHDAVFVIRAWHIAALLVLLSLGALCRNLIRYVRFMKARNA